MKCRAERLGSVSVAATMIAGMLTVTACSVGREYVPPRPTVPERFASLDHQSAISTNSDLAQDAALAAWWESFGDETLSNLVQRALESNRGLLQSLERVREARALRGVAEGPLFPRVGAGGDATRQRGSENNGTPFNTDERVLFDAGLDASWEIDIFGGVRRSVEASRADLMATVEEARAVRVTLAAEVARAYIELRALQDRQDVVERSIAAQRNTVDLTQERLDAGIAPKLDVAQARAQLATRSSQLPLILAGQRIAIHRLAVLVGVLPHELDSLLASSATIPTPPTAIAAGLPADLLRRRPDIRAAERRIAASVARIGVAEAELFPKFSLTGTFGLQSENTAELADLDSRRWSIGPAFRWRLFEGGALRRAVQAAESRERQGLLAYEDAVLRAVEEAENALVNLRYAQQRSAALLEAVDANNEAVELSDALYRGQLSTFLNVLEARRQLYDAEDQLVQSRADVALAAVALSKALGGGWSEADRLPEVK